MKLHSFLLLILCQSFSLASNSQTFSTCAFTQHHTDLIHNNLNYQNDWQAMEDQLLDLKLNNAAANFRMSGLTIPVVFHIIHQNGAENIPDAQVQQALVEINEAFRGGPTYNGVDTEIEFCLATVDENGNSTNGIVRVQSAHTNLTSSNELTMKNLSRWDPTKYLNIWVVASISGGSVAGYSYLANNHGSGIDGVVIDKNYVGADPMYTSILIHEIGHYCNLYHTFQSGCSNNDCLTSGDRICDTPPDNSTFDGANCGSYNSCNTDADDTSNQNPFQSDVNDLDNNFMDYSFFNCFNSFTNGQKERMQNSLLYYRMSLFTNEACNSINSSNAIFASYSANENDICENEDVTFTSNSLGNIVNYTWIFEGGSPNTSNLQSPTVSYANSGSFDVTLIVEDADGITDTLANANLINVTDAATCFALNNPPIPDFSAVENSICAGNAVQFIDNSTQGAVEWYWHFPNGIPQTSTEQNPVVVFNLSGTQNVTLIVTNVAGVSSQTTIFDAVQVENIPNPPTVSGQLIYCEGETPTSLSANGFNVEWTSLSNLNSTTGNTYLPQSTETLEITQTINGCTSEATSINIEFIDKPDSPSIVGETNFCQGEDFTDLTAAGNTVNWLDVNSNQITVGNTILPIVATTYAVTTTENGCTSDTAFVSIEVQSTPQAPVFNGKTNYCEDDVFEPLSTNANNATWFEVNTGNYFYGNAFTPTNAGTVLLTATENGCESNSTSLNIEVNPKPTTPQIFGENSYCENETILPLTANGNNIVWKDINTSDEFFGNVILPESAATYVVTQSVNNCKSDEVFAEVIVNELPQLEFLNLTNSVEDDISLNLEAFPAGGTFSGEGVIFNSFNPQILEPGFTEITYEYTDANGCYNSISEDVLVVNIAQNFADQAITPVSPKGTQNEIDFDFEINVEAEVNSLTNNVELIAETSVEKNATVVINSLNGTAIHQENISTNINYELNNFNFSLYPKGIYFVTFIIDNFAETKKIVNR